MIRGWTNLRFTIASSWRRESELALPAKSTVVETDRSGTLRIGDRPADLRSGLVGGSDRDRPASFAICLGLDLFYFGDFVISGDETRLIRSATQLLIQGEFTVRHDRAWEMPGAALYLAAVMSVWKSSPLLAMRLANAVLVALNRSCSAF